MSEKTEIARRLAKIVDAPFVKLEATKFTEVGYVGRDVESNDSGSVENAIQIVKKEQYKNVSAAGRKESQSSTGLKYWYLESKRAKEICESI